MKISEFSPADFSQLESAWRTLEKGIEMTWFQTYEWYKIINKHFMAEKKKAPFRKGTYVLLSDDDGKPLMIAPIQIVKTGFYVKGIGLKKGFYFIGRQGFSDYLNFIYDEFKGEYLGEIISYLTQNYGMNYFCFENVSSTCTSYSYLENVENVDKVDSLCMSLKIEDDFDFYLKNLSKSMRQNIRTANNRSARDGLKFTYRILDHITDEKADELMAIRAQRLTQKQDAVWDSSSMQAKLYTKGRNALVDFTSKPIDVMKEIDNCWCFLAECNNETAAFFYSVYKPENKTVYLLLAGVDKKYEWYSPGITQLISFIQNEISNGKPDVEFLDMTRGNEKYKYDLKSKEITTSQFSFYK
ncbi:MAG: GNAT family N-acetyltransferase [Clostridia bacterium]|nr:GNAT family N-acetyltransferase [Clostridia bacterium]